MRTSAKVAFCGIFTALAMIFSYIEALLPISVGIPGAKLGLANIAILVVLYIVGSTEALLVDIIRIILTSLLFGSFSGFIFSISGGILSILVMIVLKKLNFFSMLGVSVAGGVAHNAGQLAAAVLVMQTAGIALYFPVLLIAGIITGIINGIVGNLIKKYLPKQLFYDNI